MSDDFISKLCNRCETLKPINEFYRNKKHTDEYQYCCKVCDDLSKKNIEINRITSCGFKKNVFDW